MRKNNQLFESQMMLPDSTKFHVDRDAGVIHNVKIIGFTSKNNRVYSRKCLEEAVGLYEDRPVNANHTQAGDEVKVEDRLGKIKNVRMAESGLYGDFHFLKSHPMTERLLEAAEKMPELFGFSQRAFGTVKANAKGPEEVSKIKQVLSVDLVSDPATNKSLMESFTMQKEIKEEEMSKDEKESPVEKKMSEEEEMKKCMEAVKSVLMEEETSSDDKLKKISDLLGVVHEEEEEEEKEEKKESVSPVVSSELNAKLLCEAAGLATSHELLDDLQKLDVEAATRMVRRLAESKFKPATKNGIMGGSDNKLIGDDLARFLKN